MVRSALDAEVNGCLTHGVTDGTDPKAQIGKPDWQPDNGGVERSVPDARDDFILRVLIE
jgi:hypothetical protein